MVPHGESGLLSEVREERQRRLGSIESVWSNMIVQICVVHLMRISFAYASCKDWGQISKALKTVFQAAAGKEAEDRFLDFQEAWGTTHSGVLRLWGTRGLSLCGSFSSTGRFDEPYARLVPSSS